MRPKRYAQGVPVILNPAPAPAEVLRPELLRHLYAITPNRSEAARISGIGVTDMAGARRAAEAIHAMGVRNVVITLGGDGSLIYDGGRFESDAFDGNARLLLLGRFRGVDAAFGAQRVAADDRHLLKNDDGVTEIVERHGGGKARAARADHDGVDRFGRRASHGGRDRRGDENDGISRERRERSREKHFDRSEFHISARNLFKLSARGVHGDENPRDYRNEENTEKRKYALPVVVYEIFCNIERRTQSRCFHTQTYAREAAAMTGKRHFLPKHRSLGQL